MDTSRALTLVEQLEDNIDDLEEALQPVLTQALSETTKKLPLLDRAKLHVTIVYALGSLLFSYLKLHGVDAKNHKVFIELTRVKQYFEKIKIAEGSPESASPSTQVQVGPNLRLDKAAAARIFKHDLAETDKEVLAKAEAEARQKFLANRKLKALEASMKAKAAAKDTTMTDIDAQPTESPITDTPLTGETPTDPSENNELVASLLAAAEAGEISFPTTPKTPIPTPDATSSKSKKKDKKRKRAEQEAVELEDGEVDETKTEKSKKKNKKQRKREAKEAQEAAASQSAATING